MVPRGIRCFNAIGTVDLPASPGSVLSALGLGRHEAGSKKERRGLLLFAYHLSLDLGDRGPLSRALDTRNVRNAVAAVIVNARFAAINCQNDSQIGPTDLIEQPGWTPAVRNMVQMMVGNCKSERRR